MLGIPGPGPSVRTTGTQLPGHLQAQRLGLVHRRPDGPDLGPHQGVAALRIAPGGLQVQLARLQGGVRGQRHRAAAAHGTADRPLGSHTQPRCLVSQGRQQGPQVFTAGADLDAAWRDAGGADGPPAQTLRWTLAAARFIAADHRHALPVLARLDSLAARESLHAPLIGRTRWALARHLGTFDADGAPASLGLAWRSWLLGDRLAATSAAEAAQHEARALRQPAAEADALLLQSHLALMSAHPAMALERATAALERVPMTEPGHGEIMAQVARLRFLGGAWSAAGGLVATAPLLATPIDRSHLLAFRAELALALDHPAVAAESLAAAFSDTALDDLPLAQPLRARMHALRLETALALGTATDLTAPSLLLAELVRLGLRASIPGLAAALAVARHATNDPDGAAHALHLGLDAAIASDDLSQILAVATAFAHCGLTPPSDVAHAAAIAARHGLVTPLMNLARARGDDLTAARFATHILGHCHGIEAAALALAPWYVAATHRDPSAAASPSFEVP